VRACICHEEVLMPVGAVGALAVLGPVGAVGALAVLEPIGAAGASAVAKEATDSRAWAPIVHP
jgi:hypothetical protein